MSDSRQTPISLAYLFLTFLKVGTFSFGGFMALIAVLQRQMVEVDKKLDNQVLLDGVSLASILPGPLAVNTVGYVGYQLRGFWGGLLSMFAVILPCFLLVLLFSIFYFQYGNLNTITEIISWIIPAIVVVILVVAVNMSQKHLTAKPQYFIAAGSFLIFQLVGGVWATMAVMVSGAVAGYLIYHSKHTSDIIALSKPSLPKRLIKNILSVFLLIGLIVLLIYFIEPIAVWLLNTRVLLAFSSMSLTLFGGGYVIIPIIQESIVAHMQWLTTEEFNTAIAISQVTPGPILISAAFIGYKVAGLTGATLATIGIFLPSGLLMISCSHFLLQYKELPSITAIFKGLRPAVIGLIFSAAVTIGRSAVHDWHTGILFFILLVAALRFKVSTLWLVFGSAGLGMIATSI